MIIKILMVAIFILLSWNTFQLSKSNDFLRSELKEVITKVQSVKDDLKINKSTLDEQSKVLQEQSKSIQDQTKTLIAHSKSLQDQSKSLKEHSKQSKTNQESLKKLIEKSYKKNTSNEKESKTLNYLKSTLEKTNTKVVEQLKLIKENKNNIIEIKKITYRISDQIKKHSKDYANHYRKPVQHNYAKGNVEKKKVITKVLPKKENIPNDLNPFYKMAVALHKSKEFHNNKKLDKAKEQLLKLKSEVWKSRKIENSPTKLVMSILSSIDITNKKWANKENNYDLSKVEGKINQLFFKLGVTK